MGTLFCFRVKTSTPIEQSSKPNRLAKLKRTKRKPDFNIMIGDVTNYVYLCISAHALKTLIII